ncbi:hypothetical protein C5F59_007740 [Streptomyces sp. QL37]|uniref:hypothetical protein n=1 Tax=Streptomyces sp. QL37 TaxID=2093747 RepID=UPI001C9E951C|nr:hypothetical protein [Streptomyces sp. QL37]
MNAGQRHVDVQLPEGSWWDREVITWDAGEFRPAGEAEIAAALAEVTGVLREVGIQGNRVTVLARDADVQAVSRVTSAEQVTLGGGRGTDMRVGIATALEGRERPYSISVLTGRHAPWPE